MTLKVILNPYAGRWTAQKRIPEVHEALHSAGIPYEMVISEGPRHPIELAAEAVQGGYEAIIAAGGDGTISEVVNGMCRATRCRDTGRLPLPLGVLALGSANDFVVNLGLHRNLQSAAANFSSAKVRLVDLGSASFGPWNGGSSSPDTLFDNNSAIGLEPSITLIQQKITFLHGTLRYLLATLIGILKNPKWTASLEWEGGSYQGPVSLVTVGNNPLTGGLFYMTPHADPADGQLTFVYGYMRTRPQVLRLLPRTMKPAQGSYVEHPDIHEVNSPWLRIHTDQPTPLHTDGEIQSQAAQDVFYKIYPQRLPVLINQ